MRPGRLKALLSWRKLSKLKKDFRTPIKALWAASGISDKRIVLQTLGGDKMVVDRTIVK